MSHSKFSPKIQMTNRCRNSNKYQQIGQMILKMYLFIFILPLKNMKSSSEQSNSHNSAHSEKQIFLREQILDKEYSPEEFIDYLNQKLHIDSDLNKCSMEDLQLVVKLFQKQKNELLLSNDILIGHDDTMICDKITIVQENQPKLIQISEYPKIIEEELIADVKCIKNNSKFVNSSIVCQVNEPERIYEGGVLGIGESSYLCFKVWSYGLTEGFVLRRYGDFIWLRSILLKFYPTQIIPPIPNKKASKRLPRQILKRMRILSMFLTDLVKNSKFLNNKYVLSFLKEKDRSKFLKVREEGQNTKAFETMLSTQTQDGFLRIELSKNTFNYKNFLITALPQIQGLYKEITRKSKDMKKLTGDKINTLYDIANKFADLHEICSKFNTNQPTEGLSKLSKIYVSLNNMMVEWGNSLKKQMEQIQKNLCTFFKYVREQFMGMKQILRKEQGIQDDLIRQKQILDKQKQKLYQLHDPAKWSIPKSQIKFVPKSAIYDKREAFKIMLPKQSVKVNDLKQEMAYYLGRIFKNGDQYFIKDAEKFCQNFSEFVIKIKVNNQEIGAMWAQMSAKFSDPYKKKQEIKKAQSILESAEFSEFNESSCFQ